MEFKYSLDTIDEVIEKVRKLMEQYSVFAFYGNLGAGKTTFIKQLCLNLKVIQNVSSPTFSIINEYTTTDGKTIYHMDLYRIKSTLEAIDAGVDECLNSKDYCFVEWPDKAKELFSNDAVELHFQVISNTERKIIIALPA